MTARGIGSCSTGATGPGQDGEHRQSLRFETELRAILHDAPSNKIPSMPQEFRLEPAPQHKRAAHGKSGGRTARDPVASRYRMAWVLVFFDLPVGTKQERKAAADFRKDLIRDGYMMVQFSVYARPCASADRVETQVRRLRPKIPPKGEVRSIIVSDAQWGRMMVVRSTQTIDPEDQPKQMVFL